MRRLAIFALAAAAAFYAQAATDTVLILHTNDLHDHIRPGAEGVGGVPYVAGYVRQVRAERDDVLLLDAGDLMEKGDMLAFETKSAIMYEAMGRIGYDAAAIGNHDIDYGMGQFHECCGKAPGTAFLCVNLFKDDGTLEVPASKVFEVDGVRVGVIGSIVPRDTHSLDLKETGEAIAREAEALEDKVDLTVAVCHQGSKDCAAMARQAPLVDVFVSGHTHELLQKPRRVEETGARIVQAGSNACYVGRLEITVDLDTREVVSAAGEVVELRHDAVAPDQDMIAWVRAREQALCPRASQVVAHAREPLNMYGLARLAADAMLASSGADVAFCHPSRVMRNNLPAGDVDVNALFKTGGTNGSRLFRFSLTGDQIVQYIEGLDEERDMGQTFISGLALARVPRPEEAEKRVEPDRAYSAVMTFKEFETRFLKIMNQKHRLDAQAFPYVTCDFSYADALADFAAALNAQSVDLADYAAIEDEPKRQALAGR